VSEDQKYHSSARRTRRAYKNESSFKSKEKWKTVAILRRSERCTSFALKTDGRAWSSSENQGNREGQGDDPGTVVSRQRTFRDQYNILKKKHHE